MPVYIITRDDGLVQAPEPLPICLRCHTNRLEDGKGVTLFGCYNILGGCGKNARYICRKMGSCAEGWCEDCYSKEFIE